jgi:ATP-GRASP peptide maturase of grasp-with-spasm system
MILIVSTSGLEGTTSTVMDWITYLGAACVRLNGEDLAAGTSYALHLSGDSPLLSVTLDGVDVDLRDVGVVFYRGRSSTPSPRVASVRDQKLGASLEQQMGSELREAGKSVYSLLRDRPWVPDLYRATPNKVAALLAARDVGFEIPDTLLTSSRTAAIAFLERHDGVVVKSLGSSATLESRTGTYQLYTERVEREDLENAEASLFPCFLQAYVEKQYEIRTFFLEGSCHSMAIFSQLDRKTSVDFRRYNRQRYNRCVPVRLPETVERRIRDFMSRVGLNTGSLDIIKSPDGRYVFLEVNPIGQFGFVSKLCNYNLEKKVALFLMDKDRARGGAQ